MKTLKINLNVDSSSARLPLHHQYDGQHTPQRCGFELDMRTGELTTFISYEISNAVTIDVWNGEVLRFNVSPYASASAIENLAEENKDFFQSVLDGLEDAESFWDMNSVGEIGDTSIISVSEQMQYEDTPTTLAELDKLVQILIDYDGDAGVYEVEPSEDGIKNEVIAYIVDEVLCQGEEVGKEIAQYIISQGVDVGEWEEELKEFAEVGDEMMYEIRNAKETGFGGNYDCYVHNYYLNAKDAEAAITECNLLQDDHDNAHIAEFGEDESYLNAPRYVACLWEIDAEGNERQVEV